jgi:hypothetical protein
MAVNTYPAFTPTARAQLGVSNVSARVLLPTTGTPTIARVTNAGEQDVFVLLGSASVVATVATGLTLLARSSIFFVIGSNTDLAAITQSGGTAVTIDLGS